MVLSFTLTDICFVDAAVVALLGYAVVFFGLVLLMIVVIGMGKIFIAKEKKVAAHSDAAKAAIAAVPEAPAADAPAAPAAPAAVATEATAASDLNGKRVLVLCQGGGTSGLLANALAKAAKERGINLETAAEAYGNHVDMLPDFDLVVLAPQAASYLADLQKDCERVGNKCVACRGKQYIELSQNGDKSLAFVSEQLSK